MIQQAVPVFLFYERISLHLLQMSAELKHFENRRADISFVLDKEIVAQSDNFLSNYFAFFLMRMRNLCHIGIHLLDYQQSLYTSTNYLITKPISKFPNGCRNSYAYIVFDSIIEH